MFWIIIIIIIFFVYSQLAFEKREGDWEMPGYGKFYMNTKMEFINCIFLQFCLSLWLKTQFLKTATSPLSSLND